MEHVALAIRLEVAFQLRLVAREAAAASGRCRPTSYKMSRKGFARLAWVARLTALDCYDNFSFGG